MGWYRLVYRLRSRIQEATVRRHKLERALNNSDQVRQVLHESEALHRESILFGTASVLGGDLG